MKKPAYGLNDAPRRWWSILDSALRSYGLVMLQNKAFLVEWLAHNTKHGPDIIAFAGFGVAESMFAYWGTWA